MGRKLERVTTKAAYGLLNIAMKPLYNQMRKETKLWRENIDRMNNIASQDAMASMRRFEVHQMEDPIVLYRSIW